MRLSQDVIYSLLESSPNGLLVTDAEARIVFLNDYVERLSGYRRDELLGANRSMSWCPTGRALSTPVCGSCLRAPRASGRWDPVAI